MGLPMEGWADPSEIHVRIVIFQCLLLESFINSLLSDCQFITTVSDETEATQFVLRFDSPFEAPLADRSSDVFQSWSDSIINPVSISD